MKKFNPLDWKEVTYGENLEITSGLVHVRAAQPVAVFVEVEGVEALAGVGTEIKATFEVDVRVRVTPVGEHDAPCFLYERYQEPVEKRDLVFTNADRMPMQSGTLLEVQREVRKFQLEQRAMLDRIRSERRKLRDLETRKPASDPTPEPVEDPAPADEPAAEPAAE